VLYFKCWGDLSGLLVVLGGGDWIQVVFLLTPFIGLRHCVLQLFRCAASFHSIWVDLPSSLRIQPYESLV